MSLDIKNIEHSFTTGRLIKRYKRFLADVILDDQTTVTAHVPNTGSMKSTNESMSRVALSFHDNPKRKLKWTLELIESDGCWVGVNTSFTNRMAENAIRDRKISLLKKYDSIKREVKYGTNSRVDLLLSNEQGLCYVEVKNVTWKKNSKALFPDAVTKRGTRHLKELELMVKQGHRAVMFFVVNRNDVSSLSPAREVDPVYADALKHAADNGVELIAYRFKNSLTGHTLDKKITIIL